MWRQTTPAKKMPSNVEIKAKVKDFETFKKKAKELSGSEGEVIEQKDIFFNVPQGRLKLRFLQNKPSQLIYYERDDKSGPKMSDYFITTTNEPEDLANVLLQALGEKGVVKKKRLLHLVGQTRIHCDEVEGLGHFMELEVVMKENQSALEGEEIAKDLMFKLGVEDKDLIKGAYIDLLSSKDA
ncbi:unnamed protein product [Porites lobata]|uniref:CYTH domain-containing protein n=1 Tax=Porites lobata TaxID=104759 RepID=A0ABN8MSX5_9CNID|nr:unnamed protein product [Porites lobata]